MGRGFGLATLALLITCSAGAAPTAGTPSPAPTKKARARAPKPKLKAKASAPLPALLAEVETKYSKAGTLIAEFKQVNENATLQKKKTSSGIILIKHPDKFRWETLSPEKSLLVSNGKMFWFYTPPFAPDENGQVIERKSSDIKAKLLSAFLSGSFSRQDAEIRQESPSSFVLFPKAGSAGTVTKARVEIDPTEKVISKVFIQHSDGNTAEISLSKVELGKNLEENLFVFEAPPGTDRITE